MKILIVDDELLIRKTLAKVFERQGHETFLAPDGEAGLDLWKNMHPDLVILDVLMPKLGGVEVLQNLKSHDPDLLQIPVVMISAYSAGGTREDFVQMGATDFVRKPFDDVYVFVEHCLSLVKESH